MITALVISALLSAVRSRSSLRDSKSVAANARVTCGGNA